MHKTFGKEKNCKYVDRQGAYLIPMQGNKIGVIATDKGYFFLGGGIKHGENDITCIERECLEETGYSVVVKEKICTAEAYMNHPKIGDFHPIQSYYSGDLLWKKNAPLDKDHSLLWMEYPQIKGKMFAQMQNWALEYYIEYFLKNETEK